MSSWFGIVTTKDSASTLRETLISLFNQTIKPSYIIVVDDGSVDETSTILTNLKNKYDNLYIITLPNEGYDIRRKVINLNRALEYSKRLVSTNYHLISDDDSLYDNNYVEYLIDKMERNPKLVVTSGSRDSFDYSKVKSFVRLAPEGTGRIVNNNFFRKLGYVYPIYYGNETWILFKALQLGYEVAQYPDVRFKHLRKLGSRYKFVNEGPGMKCLGYHPLFVIGRCISSILFNTEEMGIKDSLKVAYDYFVADIKFKNDYAYHYYDEEFRRFVSNLQYQRITNYIKRIMHINILFL